MGSTLTSEDSAETLISERLLRFYVDGKYTLSAKLQAYSGYKEEIDSEPAKKLFGWYGGISLEKKKLCIGEIVQGRFEREKFGR